jgi:hypothetical protein
MSKAITKEDMALLKEASEMFNETVACLALMESKCQLKG